jgi:hypothetical protein
LILFFPLRFCEAAMLEEGVSDHRHERMTVKALPGPFCVPRTSSGDNFSFGRSK